jgi:hypothetical protein
MPARCSFCGATPELPSRLVQGGGPDSGGLPVVQICDDCVRSADEAFRTERRIGQARASEAPPRAESPPADAEHRSALGRISDWSEFELESSKLEWRAERTLASSRIPIVLLTVRRRGEDSGVLIELEGHAEPDEAHAIEAATWLVERAQAGSELGVVRDWTPFEHDGQELEWRAVRAFGVRARPAVWVHVRNATTGIGTMIELAGDAQPSVEDAVMAASDAEDLLQPASA